MTQRNTTQLEQDAFEYLNELREEGSTNMYGSSVNLRQDFGLNKQTSRTLVKMWMDNFDSDGFYDTITTDVEPQTY